MLVKFAITPTRPQAHSTGALPSPRFRVRVRASPKLYSSFHLGFHRACDFSVTFALRDCLKILSSEGRVTRDRDFFVDFRTIVDSCNSSLRSFERPPSPRPSPPRRGRIAVRHLAIRRVQATKFARRRWQRMERIIKHTRARYSLSQGERVRVRASQKPFSRSTSAMFSATKSAWERRIVLPC